MSVQNPERLATKQDLKDMYDRIRPYMGGLPEVVANKFSKGDLYSTDEKMIGQWIDGKPLYQRTFKIDLSTITRPSTSRTFTEILSIDGTDIDFFYAKEVFYKNIFDTATQEGDNWFSSAMLTDTSDFSETDVYRKNDYIKVRLLTNGGSWLRNMLGTAGCYAYLVLNYTKNSDSVISIGEATDYSTDEKIVGTWITGQPIYQKTIEVNNPSSQGSVTVNHNISNLDLVIDMKGFGIRNNYCMPFPTGATTTSVLEWATMLNGVNKTEILFTIGTKNTGTEAMSKVYFTLQYTKTT